MNTIQEIELLQQAFEKAKRVPDNGQNQLKEDNLKKKIGLKALQNIF
jgi:hypothetical protein